MGGDAPLKSESIDDIIRLSLMVISIDVCGAGSVVLVIEDSSEDLMASNPVRPRRSVDLESVFSIRDTRSVTRDGAVWVSLIRRSFD